MSTTNGKFEDENLEAPAKLLTALRELPSENLFVPPALDEAVLRAARRHLEAPGKTRSDWVRFMPWAIAVAMLALVLFLAQLVLRSPSNSHLPPTFTRHDVNHGRRLATLP